MMFKIAIFLFTLWLAIQVIGTAFAAVNEWRKLRNPERRARRGNRIVINKKTYYPKRTGRETDCEKDCPLYAYCSKGKGSICVVLGSIGDDVVMASDDDER